MAATDIRLGVVGTGYVGLTTGACFAHLGHHVVCGDIDQRKVDMLNDGHIPIVEDGLEQIVNEARALGRLEFVLGSQAAAADADIVFLCVPTPQGEDGSADLSYIEQAAARSLRCSSRVPSSSTSRRCRSVRRSPSRRSCSATTSRSSRIPSSCVRARRSATSCMPDRVVIGAANRAAAERVAELYCEHRHAGHHHRPGLGRDDQVRGQRVPGDEDQLRQRRRCDV